jgi:hypothetical protein
MVDNKTSYNNTNHFPVNPQTLMTDNKTSYNNTNYVPVKSQTLMTIVRIVVTGFIVNYLCLRFDRSIFRIVVTGLLSTMTV